MAGFENITASLRRTEADLERQLEAVRNAIAALGAGSTTVRKGRRPGKRGRPGRPKGTGKRPGRRTMSAAARKAISDAQKARWAKQKAGKK